MMKLRMKIVTEDGAKLGAQDKIAPIDKIALTAWQDVTVKANDCLLETSNQLHAQFADFLIESSYSLEAKQNRLRDAIGCAPDTPGAASAVSSFLHTINFCIHILYRLTKTIKDG